MEHGTYDLQAVHRISRSLSPPHPLSMVDIPVGHSGPICLFLELTYRPRIQQSRAVENTMFNGARGVDVHHSTFLNVGGDATIVS